MTHVKVDSVRPEEYLSAGTPGGIDVGSYANTAFNQAINLFNEVVTFSLPVVPDIRDFPEPTFDGGAFQKDPIPPAPDDLVIPGLLPINAPVFSGGSFFIPPAPPAPYIFSPL